MGDNNNSNDYNPYNQQGNQNANQNVNQNPNQPGNQPGNQQPVNQQQNYQQSANQQQGNPQQKYPQSGYPQSGYSQQGYPQPENQQNNRPPVPQYQQTQYYGQPQYQYQQPYPQYQQHKNYSGMAIASMICGIVSLCVSCCLWYISLPTSIIGLVLGIISYKNNESGKGMALAGIITSAATIILALLVALGCTFFYTGFVNEFRNSNYY